MEDQVEFRVMDYRDLRAESFDAVASIGMVEHVGEAQIDEYARQIAARLEPGGRVLNHGIVVVPPHERGVHIGGEFSNRYVFPDGELLNLSRMLRAFERAGFEALNVENLHTDYAETLRHWTTRFEERLDEAERLAGTERVRVWRLYLRAARNSFETGNNAVYQLLCSAPLTEGASPFPPEPSTSRRAGEFPRSASRPESRVSKPVHIGCSGWNYRDWRGVIYPEGLPARRWLERYAELFDTVEVNATFYRLPTEKAVKTWVEQTPPRFVFAVKASRYLTHVKRLKTIGERRGALLRPARAAGGGGKLGPVLWQLPENFQRDDERLGAGSRRCPRVATASSSATRAGSPRRSTPSCAATAPRW